MDTLTTMTYEVTDRVARITFNRPEKGNAIVADTPLELAALVERADLDPNVHVILVSGRGEGFCAGFDLSAYADGSGSAGDGTARRGTVLDGRTQAVNHLPNQPWDPMIDYQLAVLTMRRGDPDGAVRKLRDAFQNGFRDFALLEAASDLTALRNDPRYNALVTRYR